MRWTVPLLSFTLVVQGLFAASPAPAGAATGAEAATRHEKAVAALKRLGAAVTAQRTAGGEEIWVVSTNDAWLGGDEGLAHLEGLSGRVKLRLGGPISEAGLAHLAQVSGLFALDLHLTDLTDAGLVHVARLDGLERLNLTYSAVTDAGLEHLVGLRNLKWLGVVHTRVTAEGAERLQEALPEVLIQGSFIPVGPSADGGSAAPAPFARYKYDWGEEGTGKGRFRSPAGISVFAGISGRKLLVIADAGNDRIRNYSADGMFIDKWGETGEDAGQFRNPSGVAAASATEVWITDTGNHRLQKTRISTRSLTEVPGEPLGIYGAPGSGPGQLRSPTGLAVDVAGNLYIADSGNGRIQKWSPGGTFLAEWGSTGDHEGRLDDPAGVAVGPGGDLYVTDAGRHRVVRFDLDGRLLGHWGGPHELSSPRGIAVDPAGNVYVVDTGNHRVRKFSPSGENLGSVGGPESGPGQLERPYGVAVDADGNLYVTDAGPGRIVVFTQAPAAASGL